MRKGMIESNTYCWECKKPTDTKKNEICDSCGEVKTVNWQPMSSSRLVASKVLFVIMIIGAALGISILVNSFFL